MRTCKTCRFWGPETDGAIPNNKAWALCHKQYVGEFLSQDDTCDAWQQREGEPLGTGLAKFWWHPTLFAPASIIHDLRYETLQPGESTFAIDNEWLQNALVLADDSFLYRQLANIGYMMIRAWGILHTLSGRYENG